MAIETIALAVGSGDERRVDALADAVIELAEPTGATVVLAHVFEDDQFHAIRARLAETGGDVIVSARRSVKEQSSADREADLSADEVARRVGAIRDIEDRLEAAGIEYATRGTVGDDLAEAIVELAEGVGADRLVVGGRRRSPAGKAIFGSTAQAVLLNAPCPVEFVRTE